MKIAVFGAGGVGGYFGARLSRAGAEVHLLARGEHLEALVDEGLRVESPNGNLALKLPATSEPEGVGTCDVVLFCVKSTETVRAAQRLAPLLREGTAVVTLQNGVDNEEKIAAVVGWKHVVGGVAYIMSTIARPGVIVHQGKLARMIVGERDGKRSPRLRALLDICRAGGIDARLTDDIRAELWKKLAVICATAGMTATVRLPLGEIREAPAAFEMYANLAREVVSVAEAEGARLPSDTVARIVEAARELPGDWYSSLHYDMIHGKPMEIDALHGTVVRLGRRHGVPTPFCSAVFAVLEPWARRQR